MLRHNGLIYLVVVPALFFVARLAPRRVVLAMTAGCYAIYFSFQLFASAVGVHENTNYNLVKLSVALNPTAAIVTNRFGYVSRNRIQDREIIEKYIDLEEMRRGYWPSSVVPLIFRTKNERATISTKDTKRFISRFGTLAIDNFELYMAERSFMFFSLMGWGNWGMMSSLWGGTVPGSMSAKQLEDRPVIPELRTLLQPVVDAGIARHDLGQMGAFWYYNGIFPLIVVLAIALAYGLLPISAVSASFILIQVAGLFFTCLSHDFRYIYFLYFYGLFVALPLVFVERSLARKHSNAPTVLPS